MMDEEGQPPRKRRIGSGGRRILSPETKRRNEIATRLKYRALNRSAIKSRHRAEVVVKLSAAVSRRWIALQDRLECADKNALATLLMDSYEAHESRNTQSELPGPSGVQLLTSTPTQGSSSLALSTQSELPGPSGVQLLTSTPTQGSSSLALSYHMGISPIPSQAVEGEMPHSLDSSDMSGVESLISHPSSAKSVTISPAVDESENELDISVDYVQSGDFIYLQPGSSDEGQLDETWEPVVSLRSKVNPVGLEYVSTGEEIHGRVRAPPIRGTDDDEPSFTRSGLHKVLNTPKGAEETPLYIITETRLKDLAVEARSHCQSCQLPNVITIHHSGTSAHITWKCSQGHSSSFCCQETLHRCHIGDLNLGSALLLSGNNFTKVALMFKFMNLNMIHPNTFQAYQDKFIFPVIEETAEATFQATREKCAAEGVVVLGDGRNDSPGHCAQYLTYTFMTNISKDIIHVEFMDKRASKNISVNMEPKALQKGLHELQRSGIKVTELVTDAHVTIAARMRDNYKDIKHSYDVWHGAKNLGKKLAKASLTAANRPLARWQQDVTNHFWFCSRTCGGSVNVFKEKWRGLLHHVTGKHEWVLGGSVGQGGCEHEPLEKPRDDYLTPGEGPHVTLTNIIMDKQFLGNIRYFVNFRHTGELESLHNHILMYASKRFAFGYPAYRARNLLAMIDYQRHKDRPTKKDADGNDKYVAKWSKRSKDYVAMKDRVDKTYAYIPGMMAAILEMRFEDHQPLNIRPVMRMDDPRRIAPRLAPKAPPTTASILQRRGISRFGVPENEQQ